ncbi:MAG: protein TonB [Arenicella sp.]|jgi:protein TonB
MIAKKNKKANLERKRFAFFQIGLLVTGSLVLAAFEYTTVQPDEFTHNYEEEGCLTGLPDEINDDIFEEKEQKEAKSTPMIDLMQVDSFNTTQTMVDPGNTVFVDNGNITFNDGPFDPYGEIGMGIEGPTDGTIHDGWVDEEPEFPGGETAMMKWLGDHIQYPELCADMGIQGLSYVEFVVNTDGSICQVKGLQSPHEMLTAESMRVVKKMPKWKAGEQAGKKVRVRYTIPINYVLH